MIAWQKILVLLLVVFFCAACAPTQQQLAMERDFGEMKRRLADAEKSVAALRQNTDGELTERMNTLARGQAEHQAEVDSLRVEMQAFTGRFEDVGNARQEAREEVALMRDDLALKIAAMEERLAQVEAAQLAPPPAPTPQEAVSPEALYLRGMELIQRKEDFVEGREALQEYLNRNPQSPLTVNAIYWIGESYYGEKEYENAILQFQEVIEKFKDHPKVASALLKQGYAFAAMGDRKSAKVALQRLVDTFPLSEEAKKGKERLQEWGKVKSGKK